MDNTILSNKEWKESDYGNLLNITTDSFFKAHDECNIKEGKVVRQMKHKEDIKKDEQPIKRVCKDERFEAIKHSPGPNEEYIATRRCDITLGKETKKDLAANKLTMLVKYLQYENLEVLES
uniref:Uncharacterized protein n=1 Tax=Tanacetum cinerariifolium TaxID=118510 RepID=A0A6L2J539_TANCI|nr:hypothetical protein [Tanacetum cinerariifolium]